MQQKRKYSTVYARSARLLTVLLVVGLTMASFAGAALAQTPVDPYLYIEDAEVSLQDGSDCFWVPVKLETDDEISSVVFGLNYDETCLTFDDQTDSNNDGIPDSVRKLHGYFIYSVLHNNMVGDSRKEILFLARSYVQDIDGSMMTMDLANKGNKVTEIQFQVKPACRTTDGSDVPVDFEFAINSGGPWLPSISDEWGQSLAGNPLSDHAVDGTYALKFNAVPTAVKLNGGAAVNFDEEQSAGSEVGALTTVDPDSDDMHTYALVNDCGPSNDNYAFSLIGDKLVNKGPFDYEDDVVLGSDHLFKACVLSTDPYGASVYNEFTVNVVDVNEPGVEISLDNTEVYEHEASGALVGNLATEADPDVDDGAPGSHTYVLPVSPPAGCSGPDNASFQIVGDELQTNAVFDVLVKETYLICVSSEDTGGNVLYQAFTIEVMDENEAPVAVDDPGYEVILVDTADPFVFNVLANDSDPDPYDELIVGEIIPSSGLVTGGSISLAGSPATQIAFDPEEGYSGPVSFQYKAKDSAGALSNIATVTLWVVSAEDRGDCNNDGYVDAADFSATQLEIWDFMDDPRTAGKPDWRTISLGGFPGSPVGCDSNSSRNGLDGTKDSVDVADVTCTVRIFFGEVCAPIMGAADLTPAASLKVGSGLHVADGGSTVVPVLLDTAGQNVVSVAFELTVDPALFAVSSADGNGDGIADAVTVSVPDGVAKFVMVNEQTGSILVLVYGPSLPFPILQDGVIASVSLNSKGGASGQSPVTLDKVSIGSDQGQSLPVVIDSGFITFGLDETFGLDSEPSLFLPLLQTLR